MSAGAEMELFDVLDTVGEFGSASVELMAWEFSLAAAELQPLWREAITEGLLEFIEDDGAGEQVYKLTALGVERLETLRRRMAS